MKTKKNLTNLKMLIVCLVIIGSGIVNSALTAQNKSFGITIKNISSGGGIGSVLSPQISFRSNAHEVLLGINIQKKHMNISGLRAGYNFILNSGDNNEVFLFFDIAYLNNAWLNNRTVNCESFMHPENSAYYKTVRLNVLEQHLGFGVTFFKAGPVKFFGSIGVGVYKTLGLCQSNLFRDRELNDASVMLNVGVTFKIISFK